MADYTAKKIDDMEAIYGGGFKRARAELGVEAFGMQVIDMPPDFADYPEHDHSETAQEEVYVVLRGSADVDVEGERVPIDPDTMIRVGPSRSARSSRPAGRAPARAGRHAGRSLRAGEVTQLGAPDPLTRLSVDGHHPDAVVALAGRRGHLGGDAREVVGASARRRPRRGSPRGRCGASCPGSARCRRPARAPRRARAGRACSPSRAASSSTFAASCRFCSSASPWKRGPWRRKSSASRSSGDLKRPDRKPRPSGE